MMKKILPPLALMVLLGLSTAVKPVLSATVAPTKSRAEKGSIIETEPSSGEQRKAKGPYFSIIEHQEDEIRRQIEFQRAKKTGSKTIRQRENPNSPQHGVSHAGPH